MATYEEIKEAMEELDDEALMDMANAIMCAFCTAPSRFTSNAIPFRIR